MAKKLRTLRKQAHEYVRHAQRVYHYRRDELTAEELQRLENDLCELKAKIKSRSTTEEELGRFLGRFESFLKSIGGRFYPRGSLVENIEMFLIAAIVAIGVRTYVIQPFQIPTNSMYPSYYGMTHKVYAEGEEPGLLKKVLMTVDSAAGQYKLVAPATGELRIPIRFQGVPGASPFQMRYETGKGRRLLVLPAPAMDYTFMVGNQPAKITVPWDFDMQRVLAEALFGKDAHNVFQAIRESGQGGDFERIQDEYWFNTGKVFTEGQTIASFTIFSGDALFVDRMSYHFVRPSIGDAIVFRTGNIPGLQDPRYGPPEGDKYYIKRMVGEPGDKLEIRDHVLYRNGEPVTGSKAFEKNAQQIDEFNGYVNRGLLDHGRTFVIPEDHVMGLGDNSSNSRDSRDFGSIPRNEVIGRALFRYYPFSRSGFPD